MTEDEVLALFTTCSNAGRWGADDELGTLNYITPAKRVEAAALVRHGIAVGIGQELRAEPGSPVRQRIIPSAAGGILIAEDAVEITPHGFTVTHMDAIGHVSDGVKLYNNRDAATAMSPRGLLFGSIAAMRNGIFTRAVLLDVATARGVRWLDPDDTVTPADLIAAEQLAGTRVGSGDAIMVRVGLGARIQAEGPEDIRVRAGLDAACILWLHEREVAVYAGDCVEKTPSPYPRVPLPLHEIGLSAMGLALLDCPDVEAVASAVARTGQYAFLLVCSPLHIKHGSGSPVNPICVF